MATQKGPAPQSALAKMLSSGAAHARADRAHALYEQALLARLATNSPTELTNDAAANHTQPDPR